MYAVFTEVNMPPGIPADAAAKGLRASAVPSVRAAGATGAYWLAPHDGRLIGMVLFGGGRSLGGAQGASRGRPGGKRTRRRHHQHGPGAASDRPSVTGSQPARRSGPGRRSVPRSSSGLPAPKDPVCTPGWITAKVLMTARDGDYAGPAADRGRSPRLRPSSRLHGSRCRL